MKFFNLPILMLAVAVSLSWAQPAVPQPTPEQPLPSSAAEDGEEQDAPAGTRGETIKRWFEVNELTISTRYRFVRNNAGVATNNQLQWQFRGRGKLKIDKKGRYSLNLGVFTGDSLTSGWNNTGIGTGRGETNLYLEHLFFAARPVKWLEAQIGSFEVNNGENTEITGYDDDVYMTGERIRVSAPKQVYFDEISYTAAFIAVDDPPNVFRRLNRLNDWNYHQVLVRKKVSERIAFSADYTFERPLHTFRQAIRVKVPETRVLDEMSFENYQRVEPDPGYGFSIYGKKAVTKKFTLSGGFARIDRQLLNSDKFAPGKRVFINSAYKISPELSISTALIHGVGRLPMPRTPRTRFDVVLRYNLLETLRKLRVQ